MGRGWGNLLKVIPLKKKEYIKFSKTWSSSCLCYEDYKNAIKNGVTVLVLGLIWMVVIFMTHKVNIRDPRNLTLYFCHRTLQDFLQAKLGREINGCFLLKEYVEINICHSYE